MAIIEVKRKVVVVTSLSKLLHNVFAIGRVHNVVVALLGIPHRETVVVSCGESDITRPSVFENFDPGFSVECVRIESIGRFGVFVAIKFGILQIPFSLTIKGIESPMDENAESIFGKLLAVLDILASGLVVLRFNGLHQGKERCNCPNYVFHMLR